MKSSVQNEFWAALVEKAYAKLHGSYEALAGGTGIRGMTALTGGITAHYILKGNQPHDLFEILEKYLPLRALATCAIHKNDQYKHVYESVGLRVQHAYSVLRVVRLCNVKLVCVRNPWGHVEWKGNWSDHSQKWHEVPYEERMQLLAIKDNGEFWMSFCDFVRYFDDVTICQQTR
uniref:Calpain catalytic domain-containing protein n=1 Tax=Anopheles dirus TaxID=7168 RepID=A0A9I3EGW0_9DIPT